MYDARAHATRPECVPIFLAPPEQPDPPTADRPAEPPQSNPPAAIPDPGATSR